jgi:adenylate cyclase
MSENPDYPVVTKISANALNVELRSGLLRIAVAVMLTSTLWLDEHQDPTVHAKVVVAYALITCLALTLTWFNRASPWLAAPLVAVDASLVVALFHEHMFAGTPREHDLTATNISVAFILLLHAGLSFQSRMVLIFASIFLGGWLGFAMMAVLAEGGGLLTPNALSRLRLDGVLAAVFVLAAAMVLMVIKDHNRSLSRAVSAELQQSNLQRFFTPAVAAEIAQKGLSLGMTEREASVMFVDLRSFTRFSEGATGAELAAILGEFREIVSERVFAFGGTIDKFIGDAVLAVFGALQTSPDDKSNALACARAIAICLQQWEKQNITSGKPALRAGIGLHHGVILFGVINSSRHAELTVLGDVVNVAQRLEQATKLLDASVIVSDAFTSEISAVEQAAPWRRSMGMKIPGRRGGMNVHFLPREADSNGHDVLARRSAALS